MKKEEKFITEVNKRLVKHFGIPPRPEVFPRAVNMLIATILSQNTNDKNSYKALNNLKENYSSWEELLDESREKIEELIKVAGLGKQKSAAIKNFVTDLFEKRKELDLDYLRNENKLDAIEELTKFKGVGVKTASCVLLFAFDKNVCPVDTHVHRTVNKIGILKIKSKDKLFFELNKIMPENIAHQFHTNLIRLGREICRPKIQACGICPLKDICKFENKSMDNDKAYSENSFMLLDNVN